MKLVKYLKKNSEQVVSGNSSKYYAARLTFDGKCLVQLFTVNEPLCNINHIVMRSNKISLCEKRFAHLLWGACINDLKKDVYVEHGIATSNDRASEECYFDKKELQIV